MRTIIGGFVALAAALIAWASPGFPQSAAGNGANCNGAIGNGRCTSPTTAPRMGAFFRAYGQPAFGVQSAFTPAPATPNPYPVFNGTTIVNTLQFCNAPDASGNTIVSGFPLDPTKMANLLDLNASWVRNDFSPFFLDNTHNGGSYSWGALDAENCFLYLHGIEPSTSVEMQSVLYTDGTTANVTHQRYDTPTDFTTYCTAVATHVHTAFPLDHLYSIPGNELNSDYTNILGGSPPPPVVLPTASPTGTLSNTTAYNYEVTAIISSVETLPSNPYYSNVTPTAGTLKMTWGPQAGETGGYKVYREAAGGAYGLVATIAHGSALSFQDTGATAGAAPPSTSTVNTTALEANWAAYTKPCYAAIKAVDPAAVIYGFEANMDPGLTPVATQFITDERTSFTCGPGTCYDGISIHFDLTYPIAASNPGSCYNGSASVMSCFDAVETAAGSTVPIMLGEFVQTFPGQVPNEATKDFSIPVQLQLFAADTRIKYINYANVDECDLYASGFFENGCITNTSWTGNTVTQNRRLPSWYYTRPFYGLQAQVALGTTAVPRTIPTPSTPTPLPRPAGTPGIVQSKDQFPSPTLVSAPTNGNLVAGFMLNFGSSANTLFDSNGLGYTSEITSGPLSSIVLSVLDSIVSGSPTATYSDTAGSTYTEMYELSNAIPGTYCSNSTASSSGTLTCVLPSAAATDLIICGLNSQTSSITYSMASANTGTWTQDPNTGGSTNDFFWHARVTSTASTTVTWTLPATTAAQMVCADYP